MTLFKMDCKQAGFIKNIHACIYVHFPLKLLRYGQLQAP